jgi:small subunit ribosomal protein S16
MLKIRLQRIGRINLPAYRIIVVEHTEGPKTGKFTDIVGSYNPRSKEKKFDEAKIKHWMSVGAQPSDTVHNMFVSAGIIKGKKINVLPAFKAPEVVAEEAAPAEAEAPAVEAAPTEEKPAEETQTAEETPALEAPVEEEKKEEAAA